MRVFLTWSGEPSKQIADALHDFLPLVLHFVEPFLSARDIAAGGRWSIEVGKTLEESQFGIICLTRENIHADWVLFEAGALSKSLDESAVVPYLFGVELSEISAPLSQFQAKKADKESTFEVVKAINRKSDKPLDDGRLGKLFDGLWPNLAKRLSDVHIDRGSSEPLRSQEQVFEELVASIKSMYRKITDLEGALTNRLDDIEERFTPKDSFLHRLDELKDAVRFAESLAGEQPPVPSHLETASAMCEHVLSQIKGMYTSQTLSEEAKDAAQRLVVRCKSLIALSEKTKASGAQT
jgi:hypothetical protein